jgi:hypothetical protein
MAQSVLELACFTCVACTSYLLPNTCADNLCHTPRHLQASCTATISVPTVKNMRYIYYIAHANVVIPVVPTVG